MAKTAPCVHCKEPVGVDGQDETWNENPHRPAHRLCANSVPADTWIAPLNYDDLLLIWSYAKQEARGLIPPLSNAKKAQIKAALLETAQGSTTRSRAGAITLIRLLDEQRWGEHLRIHLGGGGQPKREVGFFHRRQRRMQKWSARDR